MKLKLALVGLSVAALSVGANASIEYTLKSFTSSVSGSSTNLSSSPTTSEPDVTLGAISGHGAYSLDYTAVSTSVIKSGSIALVYSNVTSGSYVLDLTAETTNGTVLGSKVFTGTFTGTGTLNFDESFASTTKTVVFYTSENIHGVFAGGGTGFGGGSSATPEPASYAVMGLGLVGLIIRRRRR